MTRVDPYRSGTSVTEEARTFGVVEDGPQPEECRPETLAGRSPADWGVRPRVRRM